LLIAAFAAKELGAARVGLVAPYLAHHELIHIEHPHRHR
jgi:hypothetical protein